ncbi:MAG TPA: preprotein translocase subunit SecE [Chthoniobacterales bacterium]|jgi:preprotein translocase subunit SecE|nr:preprotein translocase subunit SecE [Chthoniobacterales bacterium]
MFGFFRHIIRFIGESRAELAKCSWPWDPKEKGARRYRELIDSTTVVLIAMVILSGYITFWDFVMVNIVGWLVP